METQKLICVNDFISRAYDCEAFMDFLKLAIFELHKIIVYDSGMFYCAISHDCSYFKPYGDGDISYYYKKEVFEDHENYLKLAKENKIGKEVYVFKSEDITSDFESLSNDPRKNFLEEQTKYYIACLRIVYKGQFFGEIYLHREKTKPNFSNEDMFILNLFQPHISTIFNIIHKKVAVMSTEQGNQNKNIGICAMDKDMSIITSNVLGLEMLKMTTIFGSSILHHIKELCFGFENDKIKTAQKKCEIVKTKDIDIKLDVYFYPPKTGDQITYLVAMQHTSDTQIAADYKFKFTKREADIIDALISGKSNSQIASLFCLSENTIKTHIKNIYGKTGTNNRTELTYLLMMNK